MNDGKLTIIDYVDNPNREESTGTLAPIPAEFGYNLDTIEKARRWLTHPQNWFSSELFILRWDGLIPRVSRHHGQRLINEPWDDGLPWCVVQGQMQRREQNKLDDEPDQPGEIVENE